MSTASLVLQFSTEGGQLAIANVRSLGTAFSRETRAMEASWARSANYVESSINRLTGRVSAFTIAGGIMIRDGLYRMTSALLGLGSAAMQVNQQFAEFEITLASSLKSIESAKKITQEVAKITAYSPIPFKDIAFTLTGLSVLPSLNQRFVKQAQNNSLGDTEGLLRRSVRLVEMMTAFRPDKKPDEALFSIREALTGEFRSLQRRFDVPLSILTNASGLSIGQLKEKGPDAIFDALFKAFNNIVSSSAIEQRARLPSVTLENLWEQVFQMPSLSVGAEGLNKQLNNRLYDYLQRATFFFTKNPELAGSGGFETTGLSRSISTSLTRILNQTLDGFEKLATKAFDAMGVGKASTLFERGAMAFEMTARYVSENAPIWQRHVKEFFSTLIDVFKKVWEYLSPVVDYLSNNPSLAALVAIAGPGNLLNMGVGAGANALIRGGSFAARQIVGGSTVAYREATDVSRYFTTTSSSGQMRATPAGANLLANSGLTAASGSAYRAGQLVPTSTALAAGMNTSALATSGIASVAGFLAQTAALTAAFAALAYVVGDGIRTFQEKTRNDAIAAAANANITGGQSSALSAYSDVVGGPEAARKFGTLRNILSSYTASGEANKRDTLLKALGIPVDAKTNTVKLNGYDVATHDTADLSSALNKRIAEMENATIRELIAKRGRSVTASKKISADYISDLIVRVDGIESAMGFAENRGLGTFRANVSSTSQLAASRLANENLEFLTEYERTLDPSSSFRKHVDDYVKTHQSVIEDLDKASSALKTFDRRGAVNYLAAQMAGIADLIKSGKTIGEINGRRIPLMEEAARLSAIYDRLGGDTTQGYVNSFAAFPSGVPSYRGYAGSRSPLRSTGNLLDALGNDVGRAREYAKDAALTEQLTVFLRSTETFRSANVTTGPDFDVAFARLQKDFESATRISAMSPKAMQAMNSYLKLTKESYTDTTKMSQYDRLIEQERGWSRVESGNTAIRGLVSSLAEGATNTAEFVKAEEALAAARIKGAQEARKAKIAVEEYLYSLSLDRANSDESGLLRGMRDARARGYRISTGSMRSAAEREALSGNYTGTESFVRGFQTQFVRGDDFRNLATEGVAAANTIRSAFGDALGSIATMTDNVSGAFRSMVGNIAQSLSKLFANKAAEYLLNMVFGSTFSSLSPSTVGPAGGAAPSGLLANAAPFKFAAGGYISQGRGGVDDVPAVLARGEYVLNARAVQAIGVNNLEAWNRGRHSSFAMGGSVSSVATGGGGVRFGDIHYHSNSAGGTGGMDKDDMSAFEKQHRAMTIQMIEEYDRRKRASGR